MKRAAVAGALAVVLLEGFAPAHAAAVVGRARLERQGKALELHFALRGRPRLHLSHHGNQLWIDLEHTRLDLPPRPLFGQETPPLGLVRALDEGGGRARLLVEVIGRTDYAIARKPDEVLVRLAPAGLVPDLAAPILVRRDRHPAAAPPAPDSAAAAVPLAAAPPARVAVMIDPGHGGDDPGTRSADGIPEKDLALEIARGLAKALAAGGVGAALTRDGDQFLSLAERTRKANSAGADLFVSIHLNSSPNSETSGIEVYYLNNTTDRATIRLARMENAAAGYGAVTEPNLNYILSDLRQQYKANESASLARTVDAQVVADLDTVRGLGAKQGPFYVLVGAHMPAVLIECGFLSNRQEARRLRSPAYRARLAEAIATAILHYLNADVAVGNL